MQFVSADEKLAMEVKREELYKAQLDVQDRIRKAASLGDLSENAEYHFAKEENRSIQRQLAELEAKLKQVSVVSNDAVPENMVFIGHTVKLLDLYDDTEQMVQIVGEAQAPKSDSDVLPVSANRSERTVSIGQSPRAISTNTTPGFARLSVSYRK